MSEPLTKISVRQEFITELESILESDEAYGSNLQILTYALKEDVINGKFKDSWNNRIYEFVIDVDGINYKPAAKLDSFSEDELPARFDSYSEGYGSLFADIRFDRKPIGKRVKKPKCGAEGYGCGFSCIGLLKTCRILSSGKKIGTNKGAAIGQQRINKLLAKAAQMMASGDQKGSELRKVTAKNLQAVREGYDISGAERMFERQAMKQFGYVPEDNKQTSVSKEISLSNKNFKAVGDKETREKLNQWIDSYRELEQFQSEEYDESVKVNELIQRTPKERLDATVDIVNAVLKNKEKKDVTFGGIVDRNGKLQAAYSYEITPDGCFVNLLASAPWNCLDSHPDKKKGAGASAIESLIKNAIAEKRKPRIELYPVDDAIPFYKKIGFQFGDMLDMKLTEENAKKFIKTQEDSAKNRKDTKINIENENLTELEILEENALGLFTVPADFKLTSKKRGRL